MELMNGVLLNLADRLVAELDLLGPTSSSIGDGLLPVTSPLRKNGVTGCLGRSNACVKLGIPDWKFGEDGVRTPSPNRSGTGLLPSLYVH
jgi:hypothetical protein